MSIARSKLWAAQSITHPAIGHFIGWWYGDRIPFRGLRVDVSGCAVPLAHKAALRWNMYESAECRFVSRYLEPNLPAIELGSSIGAVSSIIGARLQANQQLVCVEANPQLIPCLERNLVMNASHLTWKLVNAAVAYEGPRASFSVSGDNLVSALTRDGGEDGVEVAATTLADVVATIGRVPYQLVSDIEGGEAALLAQDSEALRWCQLMIMEVHDGYTDGRPVSKHAIVDMIRDLGFALVDRYGDVVVCRRL